MRLSWAWPTADGSTCSANFLGKSFDYILREFSENYVPDTIYGDGDVKYHLGFEPSGRRMTAMRSTFA